MKTLVALVAGILLVSETTKSETQSMKTEELSAKRQSIVTIAAFTANGELPKLTNALNEGLDAGLTINEIKEILVQMYAYCGFPRSLNGISTFMSVLEAREKKGIKDDPGKEPSLLPVGTNSVELGSENQTKLIGAPATGKYVAFAPAIDQFLKGHLFGDIFSRDNLDWQSREIATVAALANLGGVEAQLQSNFKIALNTGLSKEQLKGGSFFMFGHEGRLEALSIYFGTRNKSASETRRPAHDRSGGERFVRVDHGDVITN